MIVAPLQAHLGRILGYLGSSLARPFLGGPRGLLEAYSGIGRGDSGMTCGKQLTCQTLQTTTCAKNMVFGKFLEAQSLKKACNVVVWRSRCGLESFEGTTLDAMVVVTFV